MKRSEMVGKIADVLLQFFPSSLPKTRNLIADAMLTEVEREGMMLVTDFDEPVHWDEIYENFEQDYIEDEIPKDFEVTPRKIGKLSPSEKMALMYLQDKTIEEIATRFNVTRERVRQFLYKARRKNLK